MTRSCRLVLNAALGALLLASAGPAAAAGLRFVEVQKNLVSAVGLNGARDVAVSPDGKNVYVASKLDDAVVAFSRNAATGGLRYIDVYRHVTSALVPDGLNGAHGITVSPDGKNVYVASEVDDALVTFARDATTGRLTWLQAKFDSQGKTNGLDGAEASVVSPDGAYVYAVGSVDNAVAIFSRDATTGMLTFVDFVKDGFTATGIQGAAALALSPNGANLYVCGASEDAVSIFSRNAGTGRLTEVGVVRNLQNGVTGLDKVRGIAVTADGTSAYAVGGLDDALVGFTRDPATGLLTFLQVETDGTGGVNGLNAASSVAIGPFGLSVYTTADVDDAISVFTRDPATGLLTFVERLRDGTKGIDGLNNADGVAVSPDGLNVYVAAYVDDAVSVFRKRFCGDGILDPGEQCDDSNSQDGDCCSSTCQLDAAGAACTDDGNACTDDVCNGQGACLHANNTAPCDDGAFCTDGDVCAAGSCHGTPRDCSAAGDQCNLGVCDETVDACVPQPKADGTSCDDGVACTRPDVCTAGTCVGAPVICAAADACHDAGTCDPSTGLCPNPRPDGGACDDGNACTQTDTCEEGLCTGTNPVVCAAGDQCHDAGVCDPANGTCSNATKPDGTSCNDGNLCTQTDTCVGGTCAGADPVVCTAADQCHSAGSCDPASGSCSNPAMPDGTTCNDSNACTRVDSCHSGTCTGANPVVCTASDQCHAAGTCAPATGQCTNPARTDGSTCDDGNADTENDVCTEGVCAGVTPADRDGDGIPDVRDVCPDIADPGQADANGNGIGDACECTAPAPGRCLPGGGPPKTDCLIEFNPRGTVTFNKKRTGVLGILRCTDGDPSCDVDGQANGVCTFGVAVCLGNADPRFGACQPADIRDFEVLSPNPDKAKSEMDRADGLAFERTLSGIGLEIRRAGKILTASSAPTSENMCSPLVNLEVPTPTGARPMRRTFKVKGTAVDGRIDLDRLSLECHR